MLRFEFQSQFAAPDEFVHASRLAFQGGPFEALVKGDCIEKNCRKVVLWTEDDPSTFKITRERLQLYTTCSAVYIVSNLYLIGQMRLVLQCVQGCKTCSMSCAECTAYSGSKIETAGSIIALYHSTLQGTLLAFTTPQGHGSPRHALPCAPGYVGRTTRKNLKNLRVLPFLLPIPFSLVFTPSISPDAREPRATSLLR